MKVIIPCSNKIKETIKEDLYKCHYLRQEERETTENAGLSIWNWSYPPIDRQKDVAQIHQLKVGHAAVGVFLKEMGVTESENCGWCEAVE